MLDALGRLFSKRKQSQTEEKVEVTDQPECVIVVDRSGSMDSIRDEAIEGFNTYLNGLKSDNSDSLISVYQFSDRVFPLYNGAYIRNAQPMSRETYVPNGSTALYDAIGYAVTNTAKRGVNRKVIVAILTDGEENSSTMFRRDDINKLIEKYEALGWAFIFLGAGFTQTRAEIVASSVGIRSTHTMGFNKVDLKKSYGNVGNATRSYMSTGEVGINWKKQN